MCFMSSGKRLIFGKRHRVVLTPKEAKLLKAFQRDGDILSYPELAYRALMTPSQVKDVVELLKKRALLDGFTDELIKITKTGQAVRRDVERNYYSVVVPDLKTAL